MTRLRPPPSLLPLRVLTLSLAISLALLWRDGGSLDEAWSLLFLMLPPAPDDVSALRVLLGRALASFFLITFALGAGLSCALALAMLVSRFGERAVRVVGWMGRALTGVPPMAIALGAIYWLIQVRGLPVETLFPYQPAPESDSFALMIGRNLWAWLVPVLVLAVPVLGAALYSVTHKLCDLLRDPAVDRLKARGLPQAQILHRHLGPLLLVHLARLARPMAALLLAFAIPVEELLGFEGWGRYAAKELSAAAPSGHTLAAVLWSGGLILAGILGWLSLLDRQGPPEETSQVSDPAQRLDQLSLRCGVALMLLLMLPVRWLVPDAIRIKIEDAHVVWTVELPRALLVSLMSLALVMAAVCLMGLMQTRKITRGWTAALAVTPLLAALLFWHTECGQPWFTAALVAAVPGIAAIREDFRDADKSDYIAASRALGQNQTGIWLHHMLPGAWPALPGLLLGNLATVMMMFCVLDFYSPPATGTWGAQMRLHANRVLDDPLPALAPALMLALWSLSFRLLSRASGIVQPLFRKTPFDR